MATTEIQPSLLDSVRLEPAPSPMAREKRRLAGAALRVLQFLQAHEWATNLELCRPSVGGMRAIGGRLYDLRQDGWIVEREHVKDGVWRYRLRGRKDQV